MNPDFHRLRTRLLKIAGLVLSAGAAAQSLGQSVYTDPYSINVFVSQSEGATSPDGISVGNPIGVAVDGLGNVYVANPSYELITKVSPEGVPVILAGSNGVVGSADGEGQAARFNNPAGVALDPLGNLYVADSGNQTLRKITPAGVVTTIAGTVGVRGSADGPGSSALFNTPYGVAVDASGNLYVSDQTNDTIRRVSPSGAVTTVAGLAGTKGSADGAGSSARFDNPGLIAVDPAGNVYIADQTNEEIREMTPAGVVTTLAGAPGLVGSTDGTGSAARFFFPSAVAVDAAGNVLVSDSYNSTVRRITPSGVVSTIAGNPLVRSMPGGVSGVGSDALLGEPMGIAVDGSGNIYVADTANDVLFKGSPYFGPQILSVIPDQFALPGAGVSFTVSAAAPSSITYQWNLNGAPVPGATGTTYVIASAAAADAGAYTVTVTDAAGSTTSNAANLTVGQSSLTTRLINISTRAFVGTGAGVLIPGFVVSGTGTETLLIRADGPALVPFGVSGVLLRPNLAVYGAAGNLLASNTGWGTGANPAQVAAVSAQLNAFALAQGSADCALIVSLPAGSYTVQVSGVGATTGVALAEIYEVAATGTRLTNISTRASVGVGANILIPGFVIAGSGTEQLLVRADGPSLSQFNVTGALAFPELALNNSSQAVVASNQGWSTGPDKTLVANIGAAVGAFALGPGSADSALVVSLSSGAYTMEVSGADGLTGVALAEVYEVP